MRKTLPALSIALCSFASAQDPATNVADSIENSFTYKHGIIELRNGIGKLTVPDGFKYLDAAQSERVLVDLWGNPSYPGMTMGMLLPEGSGVLDEESYAFNIQYDEIGYVEDGDADDIDYAELLTNMQQEMEEANPERTKQGYEPISLVGWATAPFYDKERKILHWAKELQFGSSEVNTLNYNIRVLGRKGVLVLNAISVMPAMQMVKNEIPKVLDIVEFAEGFRYSDFNPDIDEVAAWTIGGLVAGKILAKAGILAVVAKFGKIIVLAIFALVAGLWQRIRKKKPVPQTIDATDTNNQDGSGMPPRIT